MLRLDDRFGELETRFEATASARKELQPALVKLRDTLDHDQTQARPGR